MIVHTTRALAAWCCSRGSTLSAKVTDILCVVIAVCSTHGALAAEKPTADSQVWAATLTRTRPCDGCLVGKTYEVEVRSKRAPINFH